MSQVECRFCRASYRVASDYADASIACPDCGTTLFLDDLSAAASVEPNQPAESYDPAETAARESFAAESFAPEASSPTPPITADTFDWEAAFNAPQPKPRFSGVQLAWIVVGVVFAIIPAVRANREINEVDRLLSGEADAAVAERPAAAEIAMPAIDQDAERERLMQQENRRLQREQTQRRVAVEAEWRRQQREADRAAFQERIEQQRKDSERRREEFDAKFERMQREHERRMRQARR